MVMIAISNNICSVMYNMLICYQCVLIECHKPASCCYHFIELIIYF